MRIDKNRFWIGVTVFGFVLFFGRNDPPGLIFLIMRITVAIFAVIIALYPPKHSEEPSKWKCPKCNKFYLVKGKCDDCKIILEKIGK